MKYSKFFMDALKSIRFFHQTVFFGWKRMMDLIKRYIKLLFFVIFFYLLKFHIIHHITKLLLSWVHSWSVVLVAKLKTHYMQHETEFSKLYANNSYIIQPVVIEISLFSNLPLQYNILCLPQWLHTKNYEIYTVMHVYAYQLKIAVRIYICVSVTHMNNSNENFIFTGNLHSNQWFAINWKIIKNNNNILNLNILLCICMYIVQYTHNQYISNKKIGNCTRNTIEFKIWTIQKDYDFGYNENSFSKMFAYFQSCTTI